jgi:hypothetical protein
MALQSRSSYAVFIEEFSMRTLSALVVSSLLAVAGAGAQSPAKQSVAGEWDASYNTPGGQTSFTITFIVNGEKLSGTVHRSTGDVPLVGAAKGDSVSFVYTIQYNEHPLAMTINARVAGDAMKGSVDFGGQGQDVFEAKRASAPGKPPEQKTPTFILN